MKEYVYMNKRTNDIYLLTGHFEYFFRGCNIHFKWTTSDELTNLDINNLLSADLELIGDF